MSASQTTYPAGYVLELSSLARFTTPQLLNVLARRRTARRELAEQGVDRNSVEYRARLQGIHAVIESLQSRGADIPAA